MALATSSISLALTPVNDSNCFSLRAFNQSGTFAGFNSQLRTPNSRLFFPIQVSSAASVPGLGANHLHDDLLNSIFLGFITIDFDSLSLAVLLILLARKGLVSVRSEPVTMMRSDLSMLVSGLE